MRYRVLLAILAALMYSTPTLADSDRERGFHCLSGWDGSHYQTVAALKNILNDPSSFEHIQTVVAKRDQYGNHVLAMKYRAKNAFGAKVIQYTTSVYRNSDCQLVGGLIN